MDLNPLNSDMLEAGGFSTVLNRLLDESITTRPNVFSLTSYGVRTGGLTGHAELDLAIALANRDAAQDAVAAMSVAIAGGMPDCTLLLPARDWLLASAPFMGSAPPSAGVSAIGGGHYQGAGTMPLSNGWSCHGLVIDGISGFHIHGLGGKIIRIENDPFNTQSAADQFNSTILISRCSDFQISGLLHGEGFQNGVLGEGTSGNFLDISYGCTDWEIPALVRSNKGTNALAVGLNRATNFSGTGITGYDVSQPCTGWTVGKVVAFNGEHAVFVNIADEWDISEIAHRPKPYTYGGVLQSPYIQRTLYLLACGRGHVGRVRSFGAHKAGVLATVYDSRRAYKDLDVTIDDIFVQAPATLDSDYYIGLCPNDQCTDPAYAHTISLKIGKLTTRGVKHGVYLLDANKDEMSATTTLKRLHIDMVDIEASVTGFSLLPKGQIADLAIGQGTITVKKAASESTGTTALMGFQISSSAQAALGAAATFFNKDIRIGAVLVNAGNQPCRLSMIDGLTINGAAFNYVDDGLVGPPNSRLRIDWSKNYGSLAYRTNDSTSASQTSLLQRAPDPIRGTYRRSGSLADPGSLAAGASTTSNVTVTGARVGMPAIILLATAATGIIARAVVTANDTVAVTIVNISSAAQSPGALAYYLDVLSTLSGGT